ncbi:hypothetical protein DFA_10880 [Cavenderia fasciculata]|uniref:Wntless-like transmembrane domain-containing protein n=1 Tax=Cavenderia fasciculata TaxID=261658 RepID=F4QBN4_CACFS|nr:uncharacterized protein DFA_10880 [Cavenderia fasciculata]EGG14622.1 hypothetical protein DFA_10880 [Cavenderia fasciculata]|eukprot:XP_004351130.1 hypothetical protein DFA_10880 [Cavenderia fasciculata]
MANLLTSNIDVASLKSMIIAGLVAVGVLVISVIVGGTGPAVYEHQSFSAYDCPNGSHVWDQGSCNGVQMGVGISVPWETTISGITSLTRFWSTQMTPYANNLDTKKSIDVTALILISVEGNTGLQTLINQTFTYSVDCPAGNGSCSMINIVDFQTLDYQAYDLKVYYIGEYDQIGDVVFDIWRTKDSFTNFEISLHIAWVIISSIGIVLYLVYMRHTRMMDWSMEQKFLFALLISVLLSNGPFYVLQFAIRGWFMPFLNSFFQTLFLSVFCLYSLTILDKMRQGEVLNYYSVYHLAKNAMVAIFTIGGIVLFAWINIRDHKNPVVGPTTSVNGLQALYYFEAILLFVIVIWIVVLIILTIPTLSGKHHLIPRFTVIAAPISLYVLSVISGIFAGTFGPLNPTSLSYSFFIAMDNVFVAMCAYSYWPTKNADYRALENSENDKLFGDNDEDEYEKMQNYTYGEYLDRTRAPVLSRFIAGHHVTECGVNDVYGQYNGTKQIYGKKQNKLWLENLYGHGRKREYHHYNYHNPKQMRKGQHVRNYLLPGEYLVYHYQSRPYLIDRVNVSGYVSKWYLATNQQETAVVMANKFQNDDLNYRYDEAPQYIHHQDIDDKNVVKRFEKDEELAIRKTYERKLVNEKIDMSQRIHTPVVSRGPVMQKMSNIRTYEVPIVETYTTDIPSVVSDVNQGNVYYSGPAHHDMVAHKSVGGNDQTVFVEDPTYIPTVENVSGGHLVEQRINRDIGKDSVEYSTTSTTSTEYANDNMAKSIKSEFSPKVIMEDSMPVSQEFSKKKRSQKNSKGKKVKTATMI